jgi:hypothetical protein
MSNLLRADLARLGFYRKRDFSGHSSIRVKVASHNQIGDGAAIDDELPTK